MNFQKPFLALLAGKNLTGPEAHEIFSSLFAGKLTAAQTKTLVLLLAKKGETAEEVSACLQALKKYEPQGSIQIPGLIDTCGTGGDNSHSLNISTLSALVAAGAGCKVAKHGNRAFSSKCGSSDLMEAFGVKLDAPAASMIASIRKNGIGYFHAPNYHPTIGKFQALRRSLKVKTIFNLLGPLVNPFRLNGQLVGVANEKTFHLYTGILKKQKAVRSLVVYSDRDGMDEISTAFTTRAALITRGKLTPVRINPKTLKLRKVTAKALKIKSIQESKTKAERILKGIEKGPVIDVILINAAAAIYVAGNAKDLKDGILKARASLNSGKAYQALKGLVKSSQ